MTRFLFPISIGASISARNFFTGRSGDLSLSLVSLIADGRPKQHISLNSAALYWAHRSEDFREALGEAELVTPDGASIILASRLLKFPAQSRLPGIEIVEGLLARARQWSWPVSFIGLHMDTLENLADRCLRVYPGLNIHIKKWRQDRIFAEELASELRLRRVRLLFVSLPRPFQDVWIYQNKNIMGVPFVMGVGGSFEVLSGALRRAPDFWRQCGLEWLFRFFQQPRRRWKSTFYSTFWFAGFLLKTWILKNFGRKIPA